MGNAWLEAATKMGSVSRGVAIIHIIMSIIVLAIALHKWRESVARAKATRAFARPFATALETADLDQAKTLAADHARSPSAVVLGAALSASTPFLEVPGQGEYAASVAEVAAEREQGRVTGNLRSGLNALATIGATATLLGLLGTVVGIFNSFSALARTGGGSVDAIAVGAGEALLNTAMGIAVAIPALWLYTFWSGRADKELGAIDFATRELIQWMLVRGGPGAGRPPIASHAAQDNGRAAALTAALVAEVGTP